MHVLVVYGSKRGGTAGIARAIGDGFTDRGHRADVVTARAAGPHATAEVDVVIVGGALYTNRWHRDARRFVRTNSEFLRARPVWFFSSGPLDDSAREGRIPPTAQVQRLLHLVDARGHMTFGGLLFPDAKGFLARRMATHKAGDWRDPDQIGEWVAEIDALLAVPDRVQHDERERPDHAGAA